MYNEGAFNSYNVALDQCIVNFLIKYYIKSYDFQFSIKI